MVKNLPDNAGETGDARSIPGFGKIPWRRKWQTTPVFLPEKSQWTVACQSPLSMGFFRQEYWSGLPFPSPGVLPDPEIEPLSPALLADSLPLKK